MTWVISWLLKSKFPLTTMGPGNLLHYKHVFSPLMHSSSYFNTFFILFSFPFGLPHFSLWLIDLPQSMCIWLGSWAQLCSIYMLFSSPMLSILCACGRGRWSKRKPVERKRKGYGGRYFPPACSNRRCYLNHSVSWLKRLMLVWKNQRSFLTQEKALFIFFFSRKTI